MGSEMCIRDRLEASLAQFDGLIPNTFIKRVAVAEARITDLESEIKKLEGALAIESESIKITTSKDILDLYETEEGRLKLNTFLVSRGIFFEVIWHKDTNRVVLIAKVKGDEKTLLQIGQGFHYTDPLSPFGIPDLSHIIK